MHPKRNVDPQPPRMKTHETKSGVGVCPRLPPEPIMRMDPERTFVVILVAGIFTSSLCLIYRFCSFNYSGGEGMRIHDEPESRFFQHSPRFSSIMRTRGFRGVMSIVPVSFFIIGAIFPLWESLVIVPAPPPVKAEQLRFIYAIICSGSTAILPSRIEAEIEIIRSSGSANVLPANIAVELHFGFSSE